MPDEIEKIFSATAQSPRQFLSVHGQGCYIPAYQRAYSWDSDNVDRLIEDALNGINQLVLRPKAISFLGTVIAIHDTRYRTVQPIYRNQVPPRVMTIIDGQQRICTFSMLNIALHDQIRHFVGTYEQKAEEHFTWTLDQARILLAELEGTYRIDMTIGEGAYRYYPRITRAYEDAWSKRAAEGKYVSTVSRLIWEYTSTAAGPKLFRYVPRDGNGTPIPQHKAVSDVFGHIQTSLARLGKNHKDYDFPSLGDVITRESFCESIWGFSVPTTVVSFVQESTGKHHTDICAVLRLMILAKYLNNRMAFTIVTTESEDDAFDMFEALNTTGEPLTAFETFKPRVIETEKLEQYETSPSRPYMTKVQDYLDQFRKADERQQATSDFLIPFALSETGDKLQRRLNEQRRYLRDQYDELATSGAEAQRDFVRSLSHVAQFIQYVWHSEPRFEGLEFNDDQALLGFQVLRQIKHNVAVAPLSRFYDLARRAQNGLRIARTDDLAAAIRATIAFSMLWRAAKGGTENIDSLYREFMKSPSQTVIDGQHVDVPAFCRREIGEGLSIDRYRERLRATIRKEYPTKDDWVRAASRTPIYKHSAAIAKFMLLCAAHDAVADADAPGLVKRGVQGVAPMLTSDNWNDPQYLTVEHVAPQVRTPGWDTAFDDDPEAINRLGNLTLLPQVENAVISNKTWEYKRFLYRMLSAETPDQRTAIKAEASEAGFTLAIQTDTAMSQAKHLNLCRSIVTVHGAWDAQLVEERSKRICELAWDVLAPWLGL